MSALPDTTAPLVFSFRADTAELYRVGQALSGRQLGKVAWVPWALIAALVTYSVVEGPQLESMWPAWAAAIALTALAFAIPTRLRRRAAAASAQGSTEEQRYELTPVGLTVRGSDGQLRHAWSDMISVAETDEFFLFRLDDRSVLALPQRAIGSMAERIRVRRLLADALGDRARFAAGSPRAIA